MKILCVCLNSKFVHSSLSVWCIKAGIDKYCSASTKSKVFETTINSDISELLTLLIGEKPDLIAVSCYIWNITKSIELCRLIKKYFNCRIVLGGPEAAFRGKELLNSFDFIDYISSGEGEWSIPSLINALQNNYCLSSAEGLTYRSENGEIISTDVIYHKETPPSPYCDEYFTTLNGRIAYIESSRGCPFRCAYCLSGSVGKLKFFDINQIKTDLRRLASSGTKTIKFIDRTFNASVEHTNAILLYIKENFSEADVCFHFEIAADILHESTMRLLSEMPVGLIQLEIGIQSFNKKTLEYINRKCDFNKLKENISRLLTNGNIHIHTDLIAGLSYEDFKSFTNGFNEAYEMKPNMLQLGFLKLLHGSELKNRPQDFPAVYDDAPPYEVRETKWLSAEELSRLKLCESALDKLYNSSRFLFTLDYILEATDLSPFEMFCNFGERYNLNCISLQQLTANLYEYFSPLCNSEILREKICCDLISSGVNIKLPTELKFYDKNYKRYKKYFTELLKSNIRIVIINSNSTVFVVKETDKKDINGRYIGTYYPIESIY